MNTRGSWNKNRDQLSLNMSVRNSDVRSDGEGGGGGDNNAEQFVRNKKKVTKSESNLIKNLHSAVQKCESKVIKVIVRKRDINYIYDGKTILHLLIEYMNDDNIVIVQATQKNKFDDILVGYEDTSARRLFKCLQSVLQRCTKCVDLNILDSDNNTPVSILLKKTFRHDIFIKRDIICYFLKKKIFIDYDMPTQGNQTIRSLFERFLPQIKIPSPIATACYAGDVKVLKSLLENSTALADKAGREPLLAIVVNELCKRKDNENYHKCLDSLLETEPIHEYIDLLDDDHYSAMHYAVMANNDSVILKLLNVSLYAGSNKLSSGYEDVRVNLLSMRHPLNSVIYFWIWMRMFFQKSEFGLQTIDPKIIEVYLDSCITTNKNQETHENYQLKFNYNSFNPIGNSEMSIFDFMSERPDLQRLLQHPTVLSFIYFRWLKFKLAFYVSLMLSACYFIFAILYFTFCNGRYCLTQPLWIVVITFKLIVLLNAIFNYQHIIFLLLLVLFPMSFFDNLQEFPFYKFSILLSAIGLLYCLKGAQLFTLSKHFYLFQRVLINFMKMMVFYAICIIAFAFAFYKNARDLIAGAAQNQTADASTAENKNDSSFALNFDTAHMALLKTIIMSTGEFEAGEVEFIPNYIFYCLFIAFIVAITIVLSNLLIGLAVNDTTDILKRADLEDIIFRIKFMSRNEGIAIFLQKMFVNSKVIRKLSDIIYPVEGERCNSIILYPNRSFDRQICTDASNRGFSYYFRKIYRLFKNKREIGMKLFFKRRSNENIVPENKILVETGRLFKRLLSRSEAGDNNPPTATPDEDTVDARDENMEMTKLTILEDQPQYQRLTHRNSPVQWNKKNNGKTKEKVKRKKISKESFNKPSSKELLSIITDAKNVILAEKKKKKIKNINILDYMKEMDGKIDDVVINLLLKISKNQSGNIVQSPTSAASIAPAAKFSVAQGQPASRKLIRVRNIYYDWTAESAATRILLAAALEGKKGKHIEWPDNQDTALSAAAIVMAHISPPSNWKQNTMNGIMWEGRKYHAKCVHDRTSPPDSHLRPEELYPKPIMFKNQIDLKLMPVVHMTCDDFNERMLGVLETEGDVHGILVGNGRSIAVMKNATMHYLFDSHGRDDNHRAYTMELSRLNDLLVLAQDLVQADQMSFHPIKAPFQALKTNFESN